MSTIRRRTWLAADGQERTAWQACYRDGAGKRRSRQFTTKKAAVAFLTQASYEVAAGTHSPASTSITVRQAVEQWLAHGAAEGLERSSIRTYTLTVRDHLVPFLGHVKLAALTRPVVERFRDDLLAGRVPGGKARSRLLVGKVLTYLKGALKDAQRRGQVAQNVAVGCSVKMASRHKRKLEIGRDVPDKAEVNAMIEAAPSRWRALIVTAVFSGLRASELRGLTWDRVKFDSGALEVRQRADRWSVMGSLKSEAGERDIPLPRPAVNALKEWKLACPRGDLGLVFPDDRGRVLGHTALYRAFGKVQAAAGIVDAEGKEKYSPHAIRHFYASWLISRGFAPKRIQTLMGHASFAMSMDRYGHWLPTDAEDQERIEAGALELMTPLKAVG